MRILQSLSAYGRLMRLGQPTGSWLLFWPGAWAVLMASGDHVPGMELAVMALGAVLMRSAGCIVNDLTDQELDKQVVRTRTRPLAAGEVSRPVAIGLALGLTALAGALVLPFGWPTVLMAVAALPLVVAYPWMKRITWWPQAFLGLTFNWGALLGWVMLHGRLEWPALLLYLGGIAWTVGYDTIYAHQDEVDDGLVGIRSTARLFGTHSPRAIGLCYLLAAACWYGAGMAAHLGMFYFMALMAVVWHFTWQVRSLEPANGALCAALFRSNALIGWLLLLGLLGGRNLFF